MFNVPEWENDIPNTKLNLKHSKIKKKKNAVAKSEESQKLHNLKKPNFKAKKGKTNKWTSENNSSFYKFNKNNTSKDLIKENLAKQKDASIKLIINKNKKHDNLQEAGSKIKDKTLNYNKQSKLKNNNKQIVSSKKIHIVPKSNIHTDKTKCEKVINTKIRDSKDNKQEISCLNTSKNLNIDNNEKNRRKTNENIVLQNYDADNLDEIILNAKKNKLVATYKNEDNEAVLFDDKISNKKDDVIIENMAKQTKRKKYNCNEKKLLKKKSSDKTQLGELISNKIKTNNTQVKNTNNKTINGTNKINVQKQLKQKQFLKTLLEKNKHRTPLTINSGTKLREKMLERLNAAKFRYLNEKLYTSSGTEAQKLFVTDPVAFQTYHQGYQQQVKKWPVNPLDVVVKRIQNMPKTHLIADLGCGEAALSKRVPHTVRSFDLVAAAAGVEVCDMAHTPLLASSVDVAVYCLALMGTDLTQYLLEANRILKIGGHLFIAEVESRFDNVENFTKDVQRLGFTLKKLDKTHEVFFFMEFVKAREAPSKKSKLPTLSLKPCLYKKR